MILIPRTFERAKPVLAKAIRAKARDQHEADRLLVRYIPGYVPGYDPNSREARRNRQRNRQAQMGSDYSLRTCGGPGAYHSPSPDTRPAPVWGGAPRLRAHVAVSEAYVATSDPTPAPRTPKPVHTCAERPVRPRLTGDETVLAAPLPLV